MCPNTLLEEAIYGLFYNIRSSRAVGYNTSPSHGPLLHWPHPRSHPDRADLANTEERQEAGGWEKGSQEIVGKKQL